jgi:hypothetical protein
MIKIAIATQARPQKILWGLQKRKGGRLHIITWFRLEPHCFWQTRCSMPVKPIMATESIT